MSTSNPKTCFDFTRPLANFHDSVWKDHFIQYALETVEVDEKMEELISVLKENVRKRLVSMNEKAIGPLTKASLIDSIQRLGLCYHFEHEIDELLQHIHNNYVQNGMLTLDKDLYSIALIFRLLRQQGYHVSPDVFNKFKDEHGNFREKLIVDVEGMLSLYEAAHLSVHGEDILDEALVFTSTQLKSIYTQLSPSLCAQVNNSLKQPLRRNLPRLMARNYISTYEKNPYHDETLLVFAKLDFNMLQNQHQNEVGSISKWWKDLNFTTSLPFARDRIVEVYFWSLGVYFEPQYSIGRRLMTKVLSLISVIDDIYDAYGTLEELIPFTKAIERWDVSNMDFLPAYMKLCLTAILDIYEELEQEMAKEERDFCALYVKYELIRMVQAYFVEAKWFNSNYIPTIEEYMAVAQVTAGCHMIIATSFAGMGCIATEKELQWLTNNPKIINASTVICRLMDDIASNEFEQKRGHVVSAIECYMKQHSVTKQDTIDEFLRQVTSAWKDINEEFLNPIEVSKPLLIRVLNLSCVIDVLYKDGDGYTHSEGSTKNHIESLLLNPLPIQEHELYFFNHMDH